MIAHCLVDLASGNLGHCLADIAMTVVGGAGAILGILAFGVWVLKDVLANLFTKSGGPS